MTQIYCNTCKQDTVTDREYTGTTGRGKKKRYFISGQCGECARTKWLFVDKSGNFRRKTDDEREVAREKAKIARLKKRAKDLGLVVSFP